MEFDAKELQGAILAQDDFGHEMRVGHILNSIEGYEVSHGGTYSDQITQKPRQYDFRATIASESRAVKLAVECKNLSPNSPLIICGRNRTLDESFHYLVQSRKGNFRSKGAQIVGNSAISLRVDGENSIYPPGAFTGKSIVRLKRDQKGGLSPSPDGDIYDRWAQALASSSDLLEEAARHVHKSGPSQFPVAVLPVVVVPDESLWIAHYSSDGSLELPPRKVEKAELYVGSQTPYGWEKLHLHHTFSHIHFFTLGGFRNFLGWIANNNYAQAKIFSERAVEV